MTYILGVSEAITKKKTEYMRPITLNKAPVRGVVLFYCWLELLYYFNEAINIIINKLEY